VALPIFATGALLSAIIVPLIIKVMLALGIGFVAFTGINILLDQGYNLIVTNLQNIPTGPLQLMAIAKVDVYVTMLFSAYSIALTLKGMTAAGVLTKLNFKGIPGA